MIYHNDHNIRIAIIIAIIIVILIMLIISRRFQPPGAGWLRANQYCYQYYCKCYLYQYYYYNCYYYQYYYCNFYYYQYYYRNFYYYQYYESHCYCYNQGDCKHCTEYTDLQLDMLTFPESLPLLFSVVIHSQDITSDICIIDYITIYQYRDPKRGILSQHHICSHLKVRLNSRLRHSLVTCKPLVSHFSDPPFGTLKYVTLCACCQSCRLDLT